MNNAGMTGVTGQGSLISAAGLADELDGERPPVLLDVRWTPAGASRRDFLTAHLPGAVFLDLDTDLSGPPSRPAAAGRHPLPEPAALEKVWRAAGISGGTPVVVYDAGSSSIAARAWWLLRWSGHLDVRVLDGGLGAWQRAGLPTRSGPAELSEPGWMSVRAGAMPVADIDTVASAVDGRVTVLDARTPERFRGEVEPLDPIAGHIPGATNLPLTELLDADGSFLPSEEIRRRFDAVSSDRPLIASCGSGVTACHLVLAAALIESDVALYPGSFSGWIGAGNPVEVGDPASLPG